MEAAARPARPLALLRGLLHPLGDTVAFSLQGLAHLGRQSGRGRTFLDHRHRLDRLGRPDQQRNAAAQDGEHRKGQQRQPEAHRLGVGDEFAARDQQGAFHRTVSAPVTA
jgi:hypothetical protein